MKKFLGTFLAALAGGGVVLGALWISHTQTERIQIQEELPLHYVKHTPQTLMTGPDFSAAAELTVDAVVHIKTYYTRKTSNYESFFGYDPFRDFFGHGQNRAYPVIATGSGVIVSKNGFIATNNHVVEEAEVIEVILNDKRAYTAKVIGSDRGTDLALLKIEEEELPYIMYGNSDSLKIGEWVLAVGNPFNLTSTVTAGIVSAKSRDINVFRGSTTVKSFIQTDAAVNQGNSGGALVNTYGELVGINTAIASNTGSYTGYSFAIPVNIVKKVLDDLLEYGVVQKAVMGIHYFELDSKVAKVNDINYSNGIYVEKVILGGGAEEAGIKNGDIITAISDLKVNTSSQFQEIIQQHRPGDLLKVSLIRDDKEMNISVELKNSVGSTDLIKKDEGDFVSMLGAQLKQADRDLLGKLGIKNGLQVEELEAGKLMSAGVKEGFIIVRVDKKPVNSVNDLIEILRNKKGGVLIEGVYPNGMYAYYGFGLN